MALEKASVGKGKFTGEGGKSLDGIGPFALLGKSAHDYIMFTNV